MEYTLTPEKQKLITDHMALAKNLAAKAAKLYDLDKDTSDEVFSMAYEGLIEAAQKYDPSYGNLFSTFAHYRIKGSILDGLRHLPLLGPKKRRSIISDIRTNDYLQNQSQTKDPFKASRAMDESINKFANHIADVVTITRVGLSVEDIEESTPRDQGKDGFTRIQKTQESKVLKKAISSLPERERKLLEIAYFQDKTLSDAGKTLGLSRSWASRIHVVAIRHLRERLKKTTNIFDDTS